MLSLDDPIAWALRRCRTLTRHRRFRPALRFAGAVALLTSTACWVYDESEGTFSLHATGGLVVATEGRARAFHDTQWSGAGYIIALDVDSASPPLPGFSALVIATRARPAAAGRFVDSPSVRNAGNEVSIGLNTPSDVSTEWLTDSGIVDFKRPSGRHAVGGDFVAYLTCARCNDGKGLRAILRGQFQTHD